MGLLEHIWTNWALYYYDNLWWFPLYLLFLGCVAWLFSSEG